MYGIDYFDRRNRVWRPVESAPFLGRDAAARALRLAREARALRGLRPARLRLTPII